MNQANLDREVAHTGESIRRIRSMGFSIEPAPRVIFTQAKIQNRSRKPQVATASR